MRVQSICLPLFACLLISQPGSLADGDSELPYKYVGNSFSHKFHRPSCPFAKAMNVRHVLLFHFRKEAIEQGQEPCRYCLPPVWCRVEAKILPVKSEKENDTTDSGN